MVWEWVIFVGVMALGQFSPGPDMVLLTHTGIRLGLKAGLWTATGIAAGLALHATAAAFGIAYLMSENAILRSGIKIGAVLYLAYLVYVLLKGSVSLSENGDAGVGPAPIFRFFWRGFLCNILNPKVAIFLSSIMLPLLPDGGSRGSEWILVGIVVGEGILLWSLWVWLLQIGWMKRRYLRAWVWIDRGFALVLLVIIAQLIKGIEV